MESDQLLRIKSAMIIYELESSLGDYVVENEVLDNITEKNKNNILSRVTEKGRTNSEGVTFLVESSYLDEVFNLAIDTTEGTSLNRYMKELKELCSYLGVFDIRNAISHPNRPFPDSFWFKSATIASDPLIEKLGLGQVRQALNSALEGTLNSPPDEWINNVKWAIPNTLPHSFDHEITGLLGRDKEFKDLEFTLSKARNNLIAVVAPGGVGKTALILQFLKDLSLSPAYYDKVNAIVFCSLKNERLTAEGIEQIEAINGIDQIKQAILDDVSSLYTDRKFSTFEEVCDQLDNEKILICIDNLETLLLHSQEEFIEFNQMLPLLWRVVVTSRISIDSATTVPLDPLVKRHAISLSRNYFRKRGVQNIETTTLERVAEMANNNPLAIRLTIDLYIKGGDISQSIHQSQRDIASFSYKNLIESLKINSISVLEALYVLNESAKSELMEFLDISNEEIAEAINELSKTSLIHRSTNEIGVDCYKLSDSIRDLLLINPKNIEVRSRISEGLKKTKTKILEQETRNKQLGVTSFDEFYIASETDRSISSLVIDLNKYLSRPYNLRNIGELSSLKARFADAVLYNPKDYQLNYHYSRLLKELKDQPGELKTLNQALQINPESFRSKFAIGRHHFYSGDYEEALETLDFLKKKELEIPQNSSSKFSYSLVKLRFLCMLYLAKYDEIISETNGWKEDIYWSNIYGTYRASAYKRKTELKKYSYSENEEYIMFTIRIFDEIFADGDYPIIACVEAIKTLREFDYILDNSNYSDKLDAKYVSFVAKHYFNIISRLKDESIDSKESKDLLRKVYNANIKINALHNVEWYSNEITYEYDIEHIEELVSEGYEIVEVYHIPERDYGMSNYMFAKNSKGVQFYLNVDVFDGGWNRWGYIKKEHKLAISYDKLVENRPTPALLIVEIDQYQA